MTAHLLVPIFLFLGLALLGIGAELYTRNRVPKYLPAATILLSATTLGASMGLHEHQNATAQTSCKPDEVFLIPDNKYDLVAGCIKITQLQPLITARNTDPIQEP